MWSTARAELNVQVQVPGLSRCEWEMKMEEKFDYSKAKHEREVLAPARRAERLKLVVALVFVAVLAAGYVFQPDIHWW